MRALLMAIMEPTAAREDEFNDWYDLEHLPQMSSVPGIDSATRFIAVEGWPRYLAVYDLAEFSVLRSPAYRARTGSGFTPWSRRNLAAVRGWQRSTFIRQSPGDSILHADCQALLVWLFRGTPDLRAGAASVAGRPGVLQARAFGPGEESGEGAALLVESGALGSLPPLRELAACAALERHAALLQFSASYVRYGRGDPFGAFHGIESRGA
ncbi:MAG: hypothetical protein M3Z97_14720 [Candidatus Dormibacteraeota bacterium]|nr:hypothetical protein [Candidatus Dormibacteraeota bacterium]